MRPPIATVRPDALTARELDQGGIAEADRLEAALPGRQPVDAVAHERCQPDNLVGHLDPVARHRAQQFGLHAQPERGVRGRRRHQPGLALGEEHCGVCDQQPPVILCGRAPLGGIKHASSTLGGGEFGHEDECLSDDARQLAIEVPRHPFPQAVVALDAQGAQRRAGPNRRQDVVVDVVVLDAGDQGIRDVEADELVAKRLRDKPVIHEGLTRCDDRFGESAGGPYVALEGIEAAHKPGGEVIRTLGVLRPARDPDGNGAGARPDEGRHDRAALLELAQDGQLVERIHLVDVPLRGHD